MKLGAVYPQVELGGDPDAARHIGGSLEDLGYDHLLAYDHVLGAEHADREPPLMGPYDESHPFHEPLTLFSYLAGRTERLEFVSGVVILPQRQTALVAKQAADLAVLSGNRFRLGVGVGWNPVEYEALGEDFSTRGRREEEQIQLLRRLWSEDVVTFDGRFDRIERAGILPRPSAPVPIWLGGYSERSFRRAARFGDGFIFSNRNTEAVEHWGRIRALLDEEGRSADEFGVEYAILSDTGPEDAAARVERWAEQGGTHASIVTMGLGLDSSQAHLDYLGQVAEHLGRS